MADVPNPLPASKTFDLTGPAKCVTAVEADPSGSRLAAGGNDYMCHLYDFGGLRADGKSFRSFEVTEGHPVVAVREFRRHNLGAAAHVCRALPCCLPVPSTHFFHCCR
jgi:hypothetical protein